MIKLLAIATTLMLAASVASTCDDGCIKCSSQNACLMCDFTSGYLLSTDSCTFKFLSNCLSRSISGNCLLCQRNYYVDIQQKKCVAVSSVNIVSNCMYYSDSMTCLQCISGYYLSNKKCLKVDTPILNCVYSLGPSLCQECASGYILSPDNKKCIQIKTISNCKIYSSVDCKKCQTGYSYNINTLLYLLRDLAISEILVNNASAINLANTSTVNQAYRCAKITLTNCKKMSDYETCEECSEGYYVDTNKNCTKNPVIAIPDCSVYLSIDTCIECSKDYYLAAANICNPVTSITNCSLYDSKASSVQCIQCESKFFLSQNSCATRNLYPELCIFLGVNFDGCEQCAENYTPNTDKTKCLPSIKYCVEYTTSSSTDTVLGCAKCKDRFYSIVSSCELGTKPNCLEYIANEDLCEKCGDDYYLDSSNTCQPHQKTMYCNKYSNYVANECEECNSRSMKLTVETECIEIYNEGCIEHQDENYCKTCDDGYNNSQGTCIVIGTEYNCRRQVDGRCVLCKEGYLLDTAECTFPVTNFNKNCLKNNIDGLIGDQDKECLICHNGSVIYNYKSSYECMENEYVKATYNTNLKPNCAGYRITEGEIECSKCSPGLYLQDGSCVKNCESSYTLRPYEVAFEFFSPRYSMSLVNTCIETPRNCRVEYPIVPSSGVGALEYSCEICQPGYNLVVDLENKSYIVAKGEHTYGEIGINKLTKQPVGQCDNSTSIRTTENSNCKLFYPLIDDSLGCISCNFGYNGLTKNFVVDNCHEYDHAEEKCVKCQQGYFLKNSYMCAPVIPIQGCDLYSIVADSSICVKCQGSNPVYYLVNGVCSLVGSQITNCAIYSIDSSKCEICDEGTILNSDSTVCYTPIDNCLVHQSVPDENTDVLCEKCNYRFRPNSDYTGCVFPDSQIECWKYDQTPNGKCTHHNKIPFAIKGVCISPVAIKGCLSYDGDDNKKCVECDTGKYYLYKYTCITLGMYINLTNEILPIPIEGCLISYSTTGVECEMCDKGRYHKVDDTSQTEFCCIQNSFLNNGQCLTVAKMEYNTLDCKVFDLVMFKCILCNDDFNLNSGYCCAESEYFDLGTDVCVEIETETGILNCLQLDPEGTTTCTKCEANYFSTNSGCCESGKFWSGAACATLPLNCASADASGICVECAANNYLSVDTCCPLGEFHQVVYVNGIITVTPGCIAIDSSLENCNTFDGTNCTSCSSSRLLDPVTKTCCDSGDIFMIDKCIQADEIFPYCEKYSITSSFTCIECKAGYYLFDGVCSELGYYVDLSISFTSKSIYSYGIDNCAELDSNKVCVKCEEGSFKTLDDEYNVICCPNGSVLFDNVCASAEDIFDNCAKFNWTTLKCEVCYSSSSNEYYIHKGVCVRRGRIFSDSGSIKLGNISGCSIYHDDLNCLECRSGYLLTADVVDPTKYTCESTNCKIFSSGKCIECLDGYILETDGGTCTYHDDYIDDNSMAACTVDIYTCKSFSATKPCSCTSCISFHYFYEYGGEQMCCPYGYICLGITNDISGLNNCVEGSLTSNCKMCYLDEDRCTTKANTILIAKNVVMSDGSYKQLNYDDYEDYAYFTPYNPDCCKPGYFSNPTSVCIKIKTKNCAVVDSNLACSTCMDEYYLTSDKSCCKYDEDYDSDNKICVNNPTIVDCLTGYYKSNSHCCKKVYYWNKVTGVCEPLLDTNCEESDVFGTCIKCITDYELDNSIVYEFELLRENYDPNCNSGKYPLKMSLCEPTGNTDDITSFAENYSLYKNCDFLDLKTKACETCSSESYRVDANSICCSSNFANVDSYCSNMHLFIDGCVNYSNTQKKCLECKSGYNLQLGFCCKNGYFFDFVDGKCSIYEPNCAVYDNFRKICISCNVTSYMMNSQCCPYGTYFNSNNKKCEVSTNEKLNDCLYFSNSEQCTLCNVDAGYYLSEYICCKLGMYKEAYSGPYATCREIPDNYCAKHNDVECLECISSEYTLQSSSKCCPNTFIDIMDECVSGNSYDPNCEIFKDMNTCARCKTSVQGEFYVSNGKCCEAGFYFPHTSANSSTICIPISQATKRFCKQIDNDVCTSCQTGYYLNVNSKICCKIGEFWDGTSCTAINSITNCLQTYDDDVSNEGCNTCDTGYTLVGRACIVEDDFITDCLEGIKIAGVKTCNICSGTKVTRNSDAICCDATTQYYNNVADECVDIVNCDVYDYNTDQCILCKAGFYLAGQNPDCCEEGKWYNYTTGACETISDSACLRRSTNRNSAPSNCTKCVEISTSEKKYFDATETSQTKCKDHTASCLTYDKFADKCLSCDTGFYLDTSTRLCVAITPMTDCDIYDAYSTDCLQCKATKAPTYTSNKITACTDPTTPITSCNVYDSSSACIKCNTGFYLNTGSCVALTALNCSFNYLTKDVCIECEKDYYLSTDGLTCTIRVNSLVSAFCLERSAQNDICVQCYAGYKITQTGACEEGIPIENCEKRSLYYDYCEWCKEGYIDVPETIPANASDLRGANKCVDASTISTRLKGCIEYDNNHECVKCRTSIIELDPNTVPTADELADSVLAYRLDSDRYCYVENLVHNCKTYDGGSCVKCISGYYFDSPICKKRTIVDNCTAYEDDLDNCIECANGYYPNNTICFKQPPVADCVTYSHSDVGCFTCDVNHYLDGGSCFERRLTPNCKKFFQNTDGCEYCTDGYYLVTEDNTSFCNPYPKIHFCTVYTDTGTCDDCAPGYMISNDICVPIPDGGLITNCRSVGYYGFYCAANETCNRKYNCNSGDPCKLQSTCSDNTICNIGEICSNGDACVSKANCSDGKGCNPYDICSDGNLCPVTASCNDGSTCEVLNICNSGSSCQKIQTCEQGQECNADNTCSSGNCEFRPVCTDCVDSHYSYDTLTCASRSPTYSTDCLIASKSSDNCDVCSSYHNNYPDMADSSTCQSRVVLLSNCPVINMASDACLACYDGNFIDVNLCAPRLSTDEKYVYDKTLDTVVGCKAANYYFNGSTCTDITAVTGCESYSPISDNCTICTFREYYYGTPTCTAYSVTLDTSMNSKTFDDACLFMDPYNNECLKYNQFYYLVNNKVVQVENCDGTDGDTKCLICQKGHLLNSSGTCSVIANSRCLTNVVNEKACTECEVGYYVTNERCCALGRYYRMDTGFCDKISTETWNHCRKLDGGKCFECVEEDGYYLTHDICCRVGMYYDTSDNACKSISQTDYPSCVKLRDNVTCLECESTKYLTLGKCCSPGNFWNSTTGACAANSTSFDPLCNMFSEYYTVCADCNTGSYLSGNICCEIGKRYNGSACVSITNDNCEQYSGKVCIKCSTSFSNDGKCCLGNGTNPSKHYDESEGCIGNYYGCHNFNGTCLTCRGSLNSASANYLTGVVDNTGLGCCPSSSYFKPTTNTCISKTTAEQTQYSNCKVAEALSECIKCSDDKVIRDGLCTTADKFNIDGKLLPFSMIKNICKQMAQDGTCLACNSGYYASVGICCRLGEYWDDTECKSIAIPLCSQGNSTTCTKCDQGFYLNVDGGTCCAAGEAFDGTDCITTPIKNCVDINTTTSTCNQCAPNFSLSNSDKNCCGVGYTYVSEYKDCKNIEKSSENCYFFDRSTLTCLEKGCRDDVDVYYLSDGFCCKRGLMWDRITESCVNIVENNCEEYDPTTKVCQKCISGTGNYYILHDKCCKEGMFWNSNAKSCTDINVPHCLQYDGTTRKCLDCRNLNLYHGMCCPESYFYGATDTNMACRAPINDCSLYNLDGTCKSCKNYELVKGGVACCPANTYYDSKTKACLENLPVPSECEEYDPEQIYCERCAANYQKYSKVCCPYGKYYDSVTTLCASIKDDFQIDNCDVVNLASQLCTQCSSGYYMDDNDACTQKPSNCDQVTSAGVCTSCVNEFYVTNDNCCESGKYYDSSTSSCGTITVSDCVRLSDADVCTECSSDYYLVSETCCALGTYHDGSACVAGSIDYCSKYTDVDNCEVCQDKYTTYVTALSGSSQTKCFPISIKNCLTATISTETYDSVLINSMICDQCLNQGTLFVRKAVTTYFDYMEFRSFDSGIDNSFDPTDYDDCVNYDITDLLSTSTFECMVCEQNNSFYSDEGVCTPRAIANVDKCTGFNDTEDVCTSCTIAYFLDSGVCKPIMVAGCSMFDASKDECRLCYDEYTLTYKTDNAKNACNNDYGISAAQKPLYYSGYIEECVVMNECSSKVYEGLPLELNFLFSCHKCKRSSNIPFVSISGGQSMSTIIGIQQYFLSSSDTMDSSSLGFSTSCIAPVASTFGLDDDDFNFPANCALGMINADLEPSVKYSTNPEVLEKDKLSIFCVACQPGYRPYKHEEILYFVWKCEKIDDCVDLGRIDGCARCDTGFKLKYTDDKGVDYAYCVPNDDANCYAAYDSSNASRCGICKEGFTLNPDGICEVLQSIFCELNNFSLINMFKIVDLESIVRTNPKGVGCHNCNIGYVPTYQNDENFQCTISDYVYSNKYSPNSVFDPNCYVYSHVRDTNFCHDCNFNFILTEEHRCIPLNAALNGCSVAVDASTCKDCQSGYSLINGICAMHGKSNCMSYNDYPSNNDMTCTHCNPGFYLENNNCYKGKILDCSVYQSKNVCNQCRDGLALVVLKNSKTACYPVSSHSNCNQYTADFNIGRVVCSECVAANYQLRLLEVPVKVCDPVRLVNFCIKYDIQSTLSSSTLACTMCGEGYYLENADCKPRTVNVDNCLEYSPDSQKCAACNNPYYLNAARTECISPPTGVLGCRIYESATTCKYCEYRKYLSDGRCVSINGDFNSTGCDIFLNATDCGKCMNGYVESNKSCVVAIAQHCATYKSPSECATCEEGYVLPDTTDETTDGTESTTTSSTISCVVKSFVPSCLTSTDTSTPVCLECAPGYYLDTSNNCQSAKTLITNCENYKDSETCSGCSHGYIMTADGKECLLFAADDACASRFFLDAPTCTICNPGYQLNETGACVEVSSVSTLTGCSFTDPNNPQTCILCKSGYKMDYSGKCLTNTVNQSRGIESASIFSALWLIAAMMIFNW